MQSITLDTAAMVWDTTSDCDVSPAAWSNSPVSYLGPG